MGHRSQNYYRKTALKAAVSSVALLMSAPIVMAQESGVEAETRMIDIPAGPLLSSVQELSEAYGVAILAPDSLVRGKTGSAVSGTFGPSQALDELLNGTGLQAEDAPGGNFVLSAIEVQGASDTQSVSISGDPIDVEPEPLVADTIVVQGRFQNSLVNRLPVAKKELAVTLDEVGMADLDRLGFINPQESLLTIPNAVTGRVETSDGGVSIFLRGFRADFLVNNQAIPTFADNRGFAIDQSFIERYEVLKGPTSIAFGPVRPGGVINQVLRTPFDDNVYQVEATTSTFGGYRVEADLNQTELFRVEGLKGRLTVAQENIETAQEPADREVFAIRPIVEFDISDQTRLQLSGFYRDVEGVNQSYFPLNEDGTIPVEVDVDSFFGSANPLVNETWFAEGQFIHEFLDNLKLTLRGSYRDTETDNQYASGLYGYNGAYDGLSLDDRSAGIGAFRSTASMESYYGDAQLAGFFNLLGQRQDWLIGGTLSNLDRAAGFGFLQGPTVDLSDPATYRIPQLNLSAAPINVFSDVREELRSIYGEVFIRPADGLTIPFGLRYDDLEQTLRLNLTANGDPAKRNDEALTIRTGVNYAVNDQINVFYGYGESFSPQEAIGRNGPLDPETAVNHEIGVKARLLDNALTLNAAIFHLTRRDVATNDPTRQPDEPFFQIVGGEVVADGFELSANWRVIPTLTLDINYGYNDTEITEPIGGLIGRPEQIPEHNGSAYVTWRPECQLDGLRFGGGVRFVSDRPLYEERVDNPDLFIFNADGYAIIDVYAGYRFNENWDVQINVQNVADERYLQNLGFGQLGGGFRFGDPINAQFKITGTY